VALQPYHHEDYYGAWLGAVPTYDWPITTTIATLPDHHHNNYNWVGGGEYDDDYFE
jgi:hypothetical protein